MSVDQLLHAGEVAGLLMASIIGFFAARTLARIETKLDAHDEELRDHGERLAVLDGQRKPRRA